MRNLVSGLFLFLTALMLTSCATILNPKNQKVTVVTNASNAEVFVDNVSQGKGANVVSKMKRNGAVKQIKVVREGYKPIYTVHYQTKKSPLYIMSWIPFGVFFYPPFLDAGLKSFDHNKQVVIAEKPLVIAKRADDDKYVYLKNTAFDVKKEDLKIKRVRRRNVNKENDKGESIVKTEEDVKFDNSIFSDAVQEVLKKNNYVDTTNTVFKSRVNTFYVSAKISKLEINNIYAYHAHNYMNSVQSKVEIEWEIFDLYDQSKFKKKYTAKSGEFAIEKDNVRESINDAIQHSFYTLMADATVKKLIKKDKEEKIKLDVINLKAPESVSNVEDALSSTVTIKRKSSHGSGCAVSTDGYIITNFHVVSGDEKITVINKDGKEFPAKLVRKNEELDLALLKIDANFDKVYTLKSDKNYMIGDDIFVIGTPASLELSQTVTKGIVSGTRKNENNVYIQVDASVNGGNSGGALVKKNGELVGVINAKLFGVGVEGIGFSIPVQKVKEGLFLN